MSKNGTVHFIGDNAAAIEAGVIEAAHKLAMSKDPMEAARGRALKELAPAFSRWLDAEFEHRVHNSNDLATSLSALTGAFSDFAISLSIRAFPHSVEKAEALARAIGVGVAMHIHEAEKSGVLRDAVKKMGQHMACQL